VSQLRSWLESIGLGAHAERFERDRIDFIAHHAFVMVHLERNEPALALPQGQRSSALRSDIQRLIAGTQRGPAAQPSRTGTGRR
jgi:hypothetical protein